MNRNLPICKMGTYGKEEYSKLPWRVQWLKKKVLNLYQETKNQTSCTTVILFSCGKEYAVSSKVPEILW
jgi:hypothetical protein